MVVDFLRLVSLDSIGIETDMGGGCGRGHRHTTNKGLFSLTCIIALIHKDTALVQSQPCRKQQQVHPNVMLGEPET